MFLFDTDHLVILQQQIEPEWTRLRSRILQHPDNAFFVSIVSLHEQVAGWQAYLNKRQSVEQIVRGYHRLHEVLLDFSFRQIVGYEEQHARRFQQLRKARVRIGTMDLRIASTALIQSWTLLTRNSVDFERVPGLSFEDWTAERNV